MQAELLSLRDYLRNLDWDTARRGSLLVVAPELLKISSPRPELDIDEEKKALAEGAAAFARRIGPPGRYGYNPALLEQALDLRLFRTKTCAALAPSQMVIPTRRLPKPDLHAEDERPERLELLLRTFTKTQWEKIGSRTGFGLSDCETPQQTALFDRLLPSPLVVGKSARKQPTDRIYSATDRAHTRLRVALYVSSDAIGSAGTEAQMLYFRGRKWIHEENELTLVGDNPYAPHETTYGASLTEKVTRKRKLSDLNDASLTALVNLTSAVTVGELVARIATATRLPLTVDYRLTKLSVQTWGASATAGDVLGMLCWSLGGSVRKLSPAAYVLTWDKEPLTQHLLRLDTWEADAWLESAEGEKEPFKIDNALPYLSLADDEPQRFPRSWIERLAGGRRIFKQDELPASVQNLHFLALEERFQSQQRPEGLDSVRLSLTAFAQLLLPNDNNSIIPLEPVTFPHKVPSMAVTTIPVKWKGIGLTLRADTPEQAVELVEHTNKLPLAWLFLEGDAPTLTAALKVTKKPLGGLVRLLTVPPGSDPRVDRNILGQSASEYAKSRGRSGSDWLIPDAPGVREHCQKKLLALAALPGLAGLRLADDTPPGYDAGLSLKGIYSPGDALGYSRENRLAYWRETGTDPADIQSYSSSVTLPYFEEGRGVPISPTWQGWLRQKVVRLRREATLGLTLPLWRTELLDIFWLGYGLASPTIHLLTTWKPADDKTPSLDRYWNNGAVEYQKAGRVVSFSLAIPAPVTASTLQGYLETVRNSAKGMELALDLSSWPVDTVLKLLKFE